MSLPDPEGSPEIPDEELEDRDPDNPIATSVDPVSPFIDPIYRTVETFNTKKKYIENDPFRKMISEKTWVMQAEREEKKIKDRRTRNFYLEPYQQGKEWYNCCIIVKDVLTKKERYCDRFVLIHPEYINNPDGKYDNDGDIDHMPICNICKAANYLRIVKKKKGFRKLPPRSSWPLYPQNKIRVELGKTDELATYHPEKFYKAKALAKGKLIELPVPKARKNLPKLTSVAEKKPGDKIVEGFVGDATLSPLFIYNRGLKVRDRLKAAVNKEIFDLEMNAREIVLFNKVIADSRLNSIAIEQGRFSTLNKIMEGTYMALGPVGNHKPIIPEHYLKNMDEPIDKGSRAFLSNFPEYSRGTQFDKIMIKQDYDFFNEIHNSLRRKLIPKKLSLCDSVDKMVYSVPRFFNYWGLQDIKNIVNDFEMDDILNDVRDLPYTGVHQFLNSYVSKYKLLDSVGKFRVIREAILFYREHKDLVGFKIEQDFQPQFRYVLSYKRKEALLALEPSSVQKELIDCLPSADYTNFCTTERELTLFQSDYPNLSFVEKELVKRRYHSYCKGMGSWDKLATEEQFISKMRDYLYATIANQVPEESNILVELGISTLCPEDNLLPPASANISSFSPVNEEENMGYFINDIFGKDSDDDDSEDDEHDKDDDSDDNEIPNISSFKIPTPDENGPMDVLFTTSEGHITKSGNIDTTIGPTSSDNIPKRNISPSTSPTDQETKRTRTVFSELQSLSQIVTVTSYFMLNDKHGVISTVKGQYENNSPSLFDTLGGPSGNSLFLAIREIITTKNLPIDVPTDSDMRILLTSELRRWLNDENPVYFQKSTNEDLFKDAFIHLMRQDHEYQRLLTNAHRRRGDTVIRPNIDDEIDAYLDNKENDSVELSLLDAIQLCQNFKANVVILETEGLINGLGAFNYTGFSHIKDVPNVITPEFLSSIWILLYNKQTMKFFLS